MGNRKFYNDMNIKTTIAATFVVISSCTPQKRMMRICKKHPEVCEQRTDTITQVKMYPVLDTVYQIKRHDTTIHVTQRGDSIIIENNYYTNTLRVQERLKIDTVQQVINKTTIKKDPADSLKISQLEKRNLYLLVGCFMLLFFLFGIAATKFIKLWQDRM